MLYDSLFTCIIVSSSDGVAADAVTGGNAGVVVVVGAGVDGVVVGVGVVEGKRSASSSTF